jgi:hypothetical protein
LTVQRDGETKPVGVTPNALVNKVELQYNDRVYVMLHHHRVTILGKAHGMPHQSLEALPKGCVARGSLSSTVKVSGGYSLTWCLGVGVYVDTSRDYLLVTHMKYVGDSGNVRYYQAWLEAGGFTDWGRFYPGSGGASGETLDYSYPIGGNEIGAGYQVFKTGIKASDPVNAVTGGAHQSFMAVYDMGPRVSDSGMRLP